MRVLVVSAVESFRQQVQAACLRFSESLVSLRVTDTVGQGLELAHQFEAELVFFDLTRNVEAGLLALAALAEVRPRLIAASADKVTTDLMARALRSGAQEFLGQPVQEVEVHDIMRKSARLLAPSAQSTGARDGRIVVCFSTKGGVGKTTLTCNLGVLLASRLGRGRVAVVDANQQAPNIAPMLDLRPERWLQDAVSEYRRIDADMLRQFMTPHPTGAMVLAHSSENPLGDEFTEDQLSKILLVAKGSFDFTFVDTFPLLSSLNLAVMDLADQVLLVTEAVVPAIRSARYNLQILRKAGYEPNRITVVLNRYTPFRGNVAPDLVAETLDWPVDVVLPYNVNATIAANNGRAVVDMFPDIGLSQELALLADRLSGVAVPPRRALGMLGRVWTALRNW